MEGGSLSLNTYLKKYETCIFEAHDARGKNSAQWHHL